MEFTHDFSQKIYWMAISLFEEVLKELVTDKEYREWEGRESREFAERYFDIGKTLRKCGAC